MWYSFVAESSRRAFQPQPGVISNSVDYVVFRFGRGANTPSTYRILAFTNRGVMSVASHSVVSAAAKFWFSPSGEEVCTLKVGLRSTEYSVRYSSRSKWPRLFPTERSYRTGAVG